jgi:hypothetical protein
LSGLRQALTLSGNPSFSIQPLLPIPGRFAGMDIFARSDHAKRG